MCFVFQGSPESHPQHTDRELSSIRNRLNHPEPRHRDLTSLEDRLQNTFHQLDNMVGEDNTDHQSINVTENHTRQENGDLTPTTIAIHRLQSVLSHGQTSNGNSQPSTSGQAVAIETTPHSTNTIESGEPTTTIAKHRTQQSDISASTKTDNQMPLSPHDANNRSNQPPEGGTVENHISVKHPLHGTNNSSNQPSVGGTAENHISVRQCLQDASNSSSNQPLDGDIAENRISVRLPLHDASNRTNQPVEGVPTKVLKSLTHGTSTQTQSVSLVVANAGVQNYTIPIPLDQQTETPSVAHGNSGVVLILTPKKGPGCPQAAHGGSHQHMAKNNPKLMRTGLTEEQPLDLSKSPYRTAQTDPQVVLKKEKDSQVVTPMETSNSGAGTPAKMTTENRLADGADINLETDNDTSVDANVDAMNDKDAPCAMKREVECDIPILKVHMLPEACKEKNSKSVAAPVSKSNMQNVEAHEPVIGAVVSVSESLSEVTETVTKPSSEVPEPVNDLPFEVPEPVSIAPSEVPHPGNPLPTEVPEQMSRMSSEVLEPISEMSGPVSKPQKVVCAPLFEVPDSVSEPLPEVSKPAYKFPTEVPEPVFEAPSEVPEPISELLFEVPKPVSEAASVSELVRVPLSDIPNPICSENFSGIHKRSFELSNAVSEPSAEHSEPVSESSVVLEPLSESLPEGPDLVSSESSSEVSEPSSKVLEPPPEIKSISEPPSEVPEPVIEASKELSEIPQIISHPLSDIPEPVCNESTSEVHKPSSEFPVPYEIPKIVGEPLSEGSNPFNQCSSEISEPVCVPLSDLHKPIVEPSSEVTKPTSEPRQLVLDNIDVDVSKKVITCPETEGEKGHDITITDACDVDMEHGHETTAKSDETMCSDAESSQRSNDTLGSDVETMTSVDEKFQHGSVSDTETITVTHVTDNDTDGTIGAVSSSEEIDEACQCDRSDSITETILISSESDNESDHNESTADTDIVSSQDTDDVVSQTSGRDVQMTGVFLSSLDTGSESEIDDEQKSPVFDRNKKAEENAMVTSTPWKAMEDDCDTETEENYQEDKDGQITDYNDESKGHVKSDEKNVEVVTIKSMRDAAETNMGLTVLRLEVLSVSHNVEQTSVEQNRMQVSGTYDKIGDVDSDSVHRDPDMIMDDNSVRNISENCTDEDIESNVTEEVDSDVKEEEASSSMTEKEFELKYSGSMEFSNDDDETVEDLSIDEDSREAFKYIEPVHQQQSKLQSVEIEEEVEKIVSNSDSKGDNKNEDNSDKDIDKSEPMLGVTKTDMSGATTDTEQHNLVLADVRCLVEDLVLKSDEQYASSMTPSIEPILKAEYTVMSQPEVATHTHTSSGSQSTVISHSESAAQHSSYADCTVLFQPSSELESTILSQPSAMADSTDLSQRSSQPESTVLSQPSSQPECTTSFQPSSQQSAASSDLTPIDDCYVDNGPDSLEPDSDDEGLQLHMDVSQESVDDQLDESSMSEGALGSLVCEESINDGQITRQDFYTVTQHLTTVFATDEMPDQNVTAQNIDEAPENVAKHITDGTSINLTEVTVSTDEAKEVKIMETESTQITTDDTVQEVPGTEPEISEKTAEKIIEIQATEPKATEAIVGEMTEINTMEPEVTEKTSKIKSMEPKITKVTAEETHEIQAREPKTYEVTAEEIPKIQAMAMEPKANRVREHTPEVVAVEATLEIQAMESEVTEVTVEEAFEMQTMESKITKVIGKIPEIQSVELAATEGTIVEILEVQSMEQKATHVIEENAEIKPVDPGTTEVADNTSEIQAVEQETIEFVLEETPEIQNVELQTTEVTIDNTPYVAFIESETTKVALGETPEIQAMEPETNKVTNATADIQAMKPDTIEVIAPVSFSDEMIESLMPATSREAGHEYSGIGTAVDTTEPETVAVQDVTSGTMDSETSPMMMVNEDMIEASKAKCLVPESQIPESPLTEAPPEPASTKESKTESMLESLITAEDVENVEARLFIVTTHETTVQETAPITDAHESGMSTDDTLDTEVPETAPVIMNQTTVPESVPIVMDESSVSESDSVVIKEAPVLELVAVVMGKVVVTEPIPIAIGEAVVSEMTPVKITSVISDEVAVAVAAEREVLEASLTATASLINPEVPINESSTTTVAPKEKDLVVAQITTPERNAGIEISAETAETETTVSSLSEITKSMTDEPGVATPERASVSPPQNTTVTMKQAPGVLDQLANLDAFASCVTMETDFISYEDEHTKELPSLSKHQYFSSKPSPSSEPDNKDYLHRTPISMPRDMAALQMSKHRLEDAYDRIATEVPKLLEKAIQISPNKKVCGLTLASLPSISKSLEELSVISTTVNSIDEDVPHVEAPNSRNEDVPLLQLEMSQFTQVEKDQHIDEAAVTDVPLLDESVMEIEFVAGTDVIDEQDSKIADEMTPDVGSENLFRVPSDKDDHCKYHDHVSEYAEDQFPELQLELTQACHDRSDASEDEQDVIIVKHFTTEKNDTVICTCVSQTIGRTGELRQSNMSASEVVDLTDDPISSDAPTAIFEMETQDCSGMSDEDNKDTKLEVVEEELKDSTTNLIEDETAGANKDVQEIFLMATQNYTDKAEDEDCKDWNEQIVDDRDVSQSIFQFVSVINDSPHSEDTEAVLHVSEDTEAVKLVNADTETQEPVTQDKLSKELVTQGDNANEPVTQDYHDEEPVTQTNHAEETVIDDKPNDEQVTEAKSVAEPIPQTIELFSQESECSVSQITINVCDSPQSAPQTIDLFSQDSECETQVAQNDIDEFIVTQSELFTQTTEMEDSVILCRLAGEPMIKETQAEESVDQDVKTDEPMTQDKHAGEPETNDTEIEDWVMQDASSVETVTTKEILAEETVTQNTEVEDPAALPENTEAEKPMTKDTETKEPVTKDNDSDELVSKNIEAEETISKNSETDKPMPLDTITEEQMPMEIYAKESVTKYIEAEELMTKNADAKQPEAQNTEAGEPVIYDTATKEPMTKATFTKESVTKDIDAEEPVAKDTEVKEPVLMSLLEYIETENTEDEETVTKCYEAEETITKDTEAKGTVIHNTETQEPVAKDTDAEEPVTQEMLAEEPVNQTSEHQETMTQDKHAKKQVTKDTEVLEPVTRDTEIEDPMTQEILDEKLVTQNTENENQVTKNTKTAEPVIHDTDIEELVTKDTEVEEPVTKETLSQEPVTLNTEADRPVNQKTETEQPVSKGIEVEEPVSVPKDTEDKEPVIKDHEAEDPVNHETLVDIPVPQDKQSKESLTRDKKAEKTVNQEKYADKTETVILGNYADEPETVNQDNYDEEPVNLESYDEELVIEDKESEEPIIEDTMPEVPVTEVNSIDRTITGDPQDKQKELLLTEQIDQEVVAQNTEGEESVTAVRQSVGVIAEELASQPIEETKAEDKQTHSKTILQPIFICVNKQLSDTDNHQFSDAESDDDEPIHPPKRLCVSAPFQPANIVGAYRAPSSFYGMSFGGVACSRSQPTSPITKVPSPGVKVPSPLVSTPSPSIRAPSPGVRPSSPGGFRPRLGSLPSVVAVGRGGVGIRGVKRKSDADFIPQPSRDSDAKKSRQECVSAPSSPSVMTTSLWCQQQPYMSDSLKKRRHESEDQTANDMLVEIKCMHKKAKIDDNREEEEMHEYLPLHLTESQNQNTEYDTSPMPNENKIVDETEMLSSQPTSSEEDEPLHLYIEATQEVSGSQDDINIEEDLAAEDSEKDGDEEQGCKSEIGVIKGRRDDDEDRDGSSSNFSSEHAAGNVTQVQNMANGQNGSETQQGKGGTGDTMRDTADTLKVDVCQTRMEGVLVMVKPPEVFTMQPESETVEEIEWDAGDEITVESAAEVSYVNAEIFTTQPESETGEDIEAHTVTATEVLDVVNEEEVQAACEDVSQSDVRRELVCGGRIEQRSVSHSPSTSSVIAPQISFEVVEAIQTVVDRIQAIEEKEKREVEYSHSLNMDSVIQPLSKGYATLGNEYISGNEEMVDVAKHVFRIERSSIVIKKSNVLDGKRIYPGGVHDVLAPGVFDKESAHPDGIGEVSACPGGIDAESSPCGRMDEVSTPIDGMDDTRAHPSGKDEIPSPIDGMDDVSAHPSGKDEMPPHVDGMDDVSAHSSGVAEIPPPVDGMDDVSAPSGDFNDSMGWFPQSVSDELEWLYKPTSHHCGEKLSQSSSLLLSQDSRTVPSPSHHHGKVLLFC